jgi:hypothetical protein
MKAIRASALAIAVLIPGVVGAQGKTYSVSWVQILSSQGGTGGQSSVLGCESGQAVVGLTGRSGDQIDSLGLVCGFIQGNGTPRTGDQKPTVPVGGKGGAAFTVTCGPGEVAVGFSGRAGQNIDAISLYCAPVAGWVAGSQPVHSTETRGGGGGNQFQTKCSSGFVLVGLLVRSADAVDAAAPVCLVVTHS